MTCSNKDRQHLLDHHLEQTLVDYFQPLFQPHTEAHPSLVKKPSLRYASTPDYHQRQSWKQQPDDVELLLFLVQSMHLDDLQRYIRWVLPPVLIVLDDYDPDYKTKGVVMVHAIINKLNSSLIARTGLDRLFFESLFKCLTYLSDQPTLLSVSYPCILDLIDKMDKREGLYERVLREGVLTGFLYAGQKRKFLPILLAPIARIYQAIGILGVQYLKALIPTLCQTLTLSKDKAIHSLALDGLGAIMQTCWPRMSHYQGTLMVTLSQTWQNYYPEDVEMCDTIKQVYRLFKLTCPTKLDEDVLVKFNPIFEPLFSA